MYTINMMNLNICLELVELLKDTLEDERVPMEVKDQAYDKLIRLQAKAKVVNSARK